MFALPSAVIVYSVLAFGAVSPYQFFFLSWLGLSVSALSLFLSIARGSKTELIWVLAIGAVAMYVGAMRQAPALMIGTWTLLAARRGSSPQLSRFLLLLAALGVFEA